MGKTAFLWFIFAGWIVLLSTAAIAQLKRPRPTSFGPAMLTLVLATGLPTLQQAGIWWALGIALMGIVGYVALNHVVRVSLRRPH